MSPPTIPQKMQSSSTRTEETLIERPVRALDRAPIFLTQVLLVFLLGHQFAFLGLVESSSALLVVFGEFALFTIGLTAAFCLSVMWLAIALDRMRTRL